MRACAKINLSLAITGERSDGYHTLNTLFYPLKDIYDELQFFIENGNKTGINIECDIPDVPCEPEKNLCGRAALSFFEQAHISPLPSLTIRLIKHIPIAAGMGGGSSDAAHTLLFLQQQYGCLDNNTLWRIAVKLGADVPFFLNPISSIGCGIGEELTPVYGLPDQLPIRIFAPQFPISAAWAYKHTDIATKTAIAPHTEKLIHALRNRDYQQAAMFMRNDLEDAVCQKFPILTILRSRILELGALKVMVSGSGPTLLALFPDNNTASNFSVWSEIQQEFNLRVL